MRWPAARGRRRQLGLVESLTYDPDGIDSPSKAGSKWLHQFGDRGERGHARARRDAPSPYPDEMLPRLETDAAGNFFLLRQPANSYGVGEWIVG